MVDEQLCCSDASNIEDREFDDSFDDALSTFSTSEDGLSEAGKESSSDLEERSSGAKRRTTLVDNPENERKKVKLLLQRVAPRSRRFKESQKQPRKSRGLKSRVEDEKVVGPKKERHDPQYIPQLSDSASSEEELEALGQLTTALPVENSLFYQ